MIFIKSTPLHFIFSILLIFCSFSGRGQSYVDTIVTNKKDTIICKITLVNDVNIFYNYQNKKAIKSTQIPLNEVTYFTPEWNLESDVQNNDKKNNFNHKFNSDNKWKFGINIRYQYNYPLIQQSLSFSTYYNSHHIYAGPEYIQYLHNPKDNSSRDYWREQNWSVTFGYRYYLDSWNRSTNLYLGTSFSIFEGEYYEYHKVSPDITITNPIIVINTATIGINQKLGKYLMISLGGGMGSTAGFFLLIEDFIYHSEVVVQFRF